VDSVRRPTKPLGTGVPAVELELEPENVPVEWESPEAAVNGREDTPPSGPISRRSEAPLAPASRSVAYSARPLKPGHDSGSELPSVIVDAGEDYSALVTGLLEGNEEAGPKLIGMGEPAAKALAAKFPGPVRELRRGAGEGPPKA